MNYFCSLKTSYIFKTNFQYVVENKRIKLKLNSVQLWGEILVGWFPQLYVIQLSNMHILGGTCMQERPRIACSVVISKFCSPERIVTRKILSEIVRKLLKFPLCLLRFRLSKIRKSKSLYFIYIYIYIYIYIVSKN